MDCFINDLSLSAQFAGPRDFMSALQPLLQLRSRDPLLRERFYCSRMLHSCKVTAIYDLKTAVQMTGDRNFIKLAINWCSSLGPFWDDERQPNNNDYFEYRSFDVTDQGLGEAARRILIGNDASTYSFQLPTFTKSPLIIQQGLTEKPIEFINIVNYWSIAQLELALEKNRALNNWHDVQAEINRKFDRLVFAPNVMCKLLSMPFSKAVKDRIFNLLDILNRLVLSTEESGKLSAAGEEILSNYFAGSCAAKTPLFKPETDDNQHNFRSDMTFLDPNDDSISLFCHWHGKIQTPQIRIHFEWPRPKNQREIKIVYIGPKITKK